VLAASGIYFVIDALLFRFIARKLPARVIGYETKICDRNRYYYPVARYEDGGRVFRVRSAIGSGAVPFGIGETVTVLVRGQMHATARIKQRSRFFIAFILSLLGAGFVAPLSIETDYAVMQWYLPAVVALASLFEAYTFAWQRRKQSTFDYTPDGDGVIGHRPDDTFQDDPEAVKPYTVPKKIRFATLLLGAALLGGAAWIYDHESAFLSGASGAQGKVISLESHRNSDGDLLYAPRVRFSSGGRETYAFTSRVSSSHPGYRIGDTVTVLYDPADPQHAQIDRGLWNHLIPMAVAALGALLLIVSAAALLRQKQT